MALIVEDGTGLADAESYVSVAVFKTYCLGRGMDITGMTDAIIEQKLRLAADYVDGRWEFKGTRLLSTQALEFPRDSLVDRSGHTITGVPKRLKDAVCDLAQAAYAEGDLFSNLDRGGRVVSETVGPISTTYAADAPATKVFDAAESKLRPYMSDPHEGIAPYSGTEAEGVDFLFTTGQFEDPAAAVDPVE